jgi:hypothetical protein
MLPVASLVIMKHIIVETKTKPISSNTYKKVQLSSSGDELKGSSLVFAEKFIRRSLDDAAGERKLRTDAGQVGVDVASGLATLVDAPSSLLVYAIIII